MVARWLGDARRLEDRPPSEGAALRLSDFRRVAGELGRVLAGVEAGEGGAAERTLLSAVAAGRTQAIAAVFACPRAVFIEYVVTAPWNLLGPGDPPDLRAVRGAGTALIETASAWSRQRGCGGRVALQAENLRCLRFYERMGFAEMTADDDPLSLVPRGERGWSPGIEHLVRTGRRSQAEADTPWLLLDPSRDVASAVAAR